MELPSEREIFEAYLDKASAEASSLAAQIKDCQRCGLHKKGKQPLSGAGYPLADFFILKARASESEHRESVAFAGTTGEILTKAFEKLGSDISFVYGTNAIKCYGGGKKVSEYEVKECLYYLKAEIEICQPRVILALGHIAYYALTLLGENLEETKYRPGSTFRLRPDLQVVVTHDFEKALGDENLKLRFWKDLQLAERLIRKEIAKEQDS